MKKISMILVMLFSMTTAAWAETDDALTEQAMASVRQRTEEMSALGVPQAKAEKMLTLMLQNRFREENIVRAQRVVMQNAREGLPVNPVMSKAMEGMAKGVTDDRTVAAMEQVRSRQMFSYRIAGKLSTDPETVEALADTAYDALAARMREQDMERIAARLEVWTRQQTENMGEEMALQTLQTVRTMARLGAQSPDVSETVCQALRHGYTVRQMHQIRTNFTAQAQNTDPEPLARQYAAAIGKGGEVSNASQNEKAVSGGGDSGGSGGGDSGGSGGGDSGGSGGGDSGGSGGGGSGGSGGGDSGGSGGGDSGGSGGGDSGGSGGGGSGGSGGGDSGGSGGGDSGGSGGGGSGGSGGGDSGGSGGGGSGGSGGGGSGGSGGGNNG